MSETPKYPEPKSTRNVALQGGNVATITTTVEFHPDDLIARFRKDLEQTETNLKNLEGQKEEILKALEKLTANAS